MKLKLLKNIHLIISTLIVIPIGLIYGFCPDLLFAVKINSTDEDNIFRAIMGLYFAFALLWVLGIFNIEYWKTATISNICFMLGLGFGRILSIILDGIPCKLFIFGTVGELFLGFYSIVQIISIKDERSSNKHNCN